MELRPPAKIAIGVVGALGTIAVLHFTIFASRADAYSKARSEYDTTISAYRDAGRTPDQGQINKFRYATLKKKIQYWEAAEKLNIFQPAIYSTNDYVIVLKYHRQFAWDATRKLQDLRREGEAGNGPKLTFLTGNGSWNFVDALPQELTSRGIAVEDEVNTLRDEDRLLNSLAAGSPQYVQRTNTFNRLLLRLGLDVNYRKNLKDYMGQQVATWYTINRLDQVMKGLPPDFFGKDATEDQKLNTMYSLFRMEWPKDTKGNESMMLAQRQGEALLNLIQLAKEKKITEVNYVRFYDFGELRWEDFDPNQQPTPTPEAAMMGFDEFGGGAEGMGMDFDGAGGGLEGGGGRFGGGGGAAATPVEVGEAVGLNCPLEIHVRGSNSAVMEFLYAIPNAPNPMEVDKLRLRNINPAEGVVEARVFVNVIGFANLAIAKDAEGKTKVINQQDIEVKVTELRRELAELSNRIGARDMAVADGLVVVEGTNYRLVSPSPTPHPAAPSPTVPPPPPVEGM